MLSWLFSIDEFCIKRIIKEEKDKKDKKNYYPGAEEIEFWYRIILRSSNALWIQTL